MLPSTLDELAHEVNVVSARASQLWTRAADSCVRSTRGGWSLAQCLSHLALSTNAYLPAWRAAFQAPGAVLKTDSRQWRLDLWGRLLVWFLEPPPKIRFRTKRGFEVASSPAALDDFLQSQRELSNIIAQSRDFAIDRIQIRSAYDSRVRYSVWSSFVITLVHQRRHLWQAEMVLQQTSPGHKPSQLTM